MKLLLKYWNLLFFFTQTHTQIHSKALTHTWREKFIQINDNYSEAIETSRLSFLLKCHEI